MKRFVNYCFLLCFISLLSSSCTDRKIVNRTPKTPSEVSVFIWDAMDTYYLWEDKVSPLAIRRGAGEWYSYLNLHEGKNVELFNNLLYKKDEKGQAVDRWSSIIEDYDKYEQFINGVHENFGFEFEIIEDKNGVNGVVLYVTPNGPAEKSGVKRGDVFTKVNGKTLTKSNYKDLLLEQNQCEISIIKPLPKNIELTATTALAPPILKMLAYNVDGTIVGYLLYNVFQGTDEHHLDLNSKIKELKKAGVKELVLDLRYNGGGSVYNASLLGSMLVKKEYIGKTFDRREYNTALTAEFTSNNRDDLLRDRLTDKILDVATLKQQIGTINSLELDRVFILASGSTASASELLINGLAPYMEVVLIGAQTYGKYVGSMKPIKDKREDINHKYALQPIVMKFFNAKGVGNYSKGFTPDYRRDEHDVFPQYLPLGDIQEYMFKTALDIIRGKTVDPDKYTATTRTRSIQTIDRSVNSSPFAHKSFDERISLEIQQKSR